VFNFKAIIFKTILLSYLVIIVVIGANAQNNLPDSVKQSDTIPINDSIIVNAFPDTLNTNIDTLENKTANDSIVELSQIDSSLTTTSLDSIEIKRDSIEFSDTIISEKSYDEILNELKDSLYFEKPDTSYFIMSKLTDFVRNDTILFSDTAKQAIQKLIDFNANYNIDSIKSYIEKNIYNLNFQDSTLQFLSDSILKSIRFLVDKIPEDSLILSFANINGDSIWFKNAEHEQDSMRLNLYDNRGEYATLWIVKSDTSVFEIYLEDGIYIEKARAQKVVNQKLDTDIGFPKLRKVKKIDKIIPIWDLEGSADIRFNQGYISDSWSEGGESSISTLSILKYSADYSYGKLKNFDTDFEYRLGYIQAGDNDLRKNDDKFEINAKYGRSAVNDWYYSALLNFKTQLLKGYEYPTDSTRTNISEILSPAYLVFSLGLDYKPSNKLTVLISPVTSKFTIVADTVNFDQTRYGVGEDEYIRKEIGAYIKAISKIKFRDNISLENKINFFTNYTNNPQNIDVDWEVDLKVKLTSYISMTVNAHFIYDDDVKFIDKDGNENGARAQFKELFGIGFVYSF